MRKLLLSATALTAMATVASAADLPARAPAVAPAPVYAAPVFTWTGFYVGVNAGAAWNNKCSTWNPAIGGVAAVGWNSLCNNNNNDAAFTGGGQIGYNWQVGAFVFGLEADINGIAHGNNDAVFVNNLAVVGGAPAGTYQLHENRPDWFGTVRGRVGYAWNQALLYVTGGLAYGGNHNASVNYWLPAAGFPPVGAPNATFAASNNNGIGWSLGGGLEYAFSTNWTARVEYLHVALGNDNNGAIACSGGSCAAFAGTTWGRTNHNSFDVVRVGLNYKFGGVAAAPVLARY